MHWIAIKDDVGRTTWINLAAVALVIDRPDYAPQPPRRAMLVEYASEGGQTVITDPASMHRLEEHLANLCDAADRAAGIGPDADPDAENPFPDEKEPWAPPSA